MKTYLHYLFGKLAAAWKEDKFQFFFWAFLISVFAGLPIFGLAVTQNLGLIWTIIGAVFVGYSVVFALFLSLPNWKDYFYWVLELIMLPKKIAVGIYHLLKGSYASYRKWKGERC